MIGRVSSWFKRKCGSNKRNRSRVHVGFPAFIEVGDVITPVTTQNLSMNGALCTGADSFIEGEACQLIIPVAGGIRIAVEGVVVRSDGESTAIRFTGMDPDSFTHLRRMVELNANDPDRIERELRGEDPTPPECRKS